MGLLIQSSFTTSEGVVVSSVYSKLVSFTYDIAKTGLTLILKTDAYISRDIGHSGYRPVSIPTLPTLLTIPNAPVQSLEYVYTLLKLKLEQLGYTVENVLEDGQSLLLNGVTLPPPLPSPPQGEVSPPP